MTVTKKDTAARKERKLREEHRVARKRVITLDAELERKEQELRAALKIKGPVKVRPILPHKSSHTSEATAVAVLSDFHVEEEVMSKKVSGLNKYNLDIAKQRSERVFQRIERMIRKERQDVEIKTLVLFLGGDFISGNIHEELLSTCLLRPIEAIMFAQELLESGVRFLLEHTDLQIVCVCHVGNHSRLTRKVHYGTEQGNSLEYMMYHAMRSRFLDEKRITFNIAEGYHTYLPVYDWTVRFHHGHNIRYWGGVGGLTIPLNKAIHQWNLTKQATCDVLGHFHEAMSMRRFVVNGSLIGFSPFAIAMKAEYQPPIQQFFLLDKKRGRTVEIPLFAE